MQTPSIERSLLLAPCETGIQEFSSESPEINVASSPTCRELNQEFEASKLESQVFAHQLLADIERLDFSKISKQMRVLKNDTGCLRLDQCPNDFYPKVVTVNGNSIILENEDDVQRSNKCLEQIQEATRLATSDSQKAIELYKEARSTPKITNIFLPDFLVVLAQVDVKKALDIALKGEIDINVLSQFAEKVAPSLPEVALEIAKIQRDDFACCNVLKHVVAAIALSDLDKALRFASAFPSIYLTNQLFATIATSIAPTNFRKALEIIDARFPKDSENYRYAEDLIMALVEIAPKLDSYDEQEIIVQRFCNFAERILNSLADTSHDIRLLANMAKGLIQLGRNDLAISFFQNALSLGEKNPRAFILRPYVDVAECLLFLKNTQERSTLFTKFVETLVAQIKNTVGGRDVINILIPYLFKLDPETAEELFESQILPFLSTLSDPVDQIETLKTACRHLPINSPSAAARILRKIFVSEKKSSPEHAVEFFMLSTVDCISEQLFSNRAFVLKFIRSDEFKAIPEACKLQFLLKALAAMPEKFPDVQDRLFDLVNQQVN